MLNNLYLDTLTSDTEFSTLSNTLKVSINKHKKRIRDGGNLATVFGHAVLPLPMGRNNTGASSDGGHTLVAPPQSVVWSKARITNHIRELTG